MYNISNIHFHVDKIMYNIIFNNHRYLYQKPFNSKKKLLILLHKLFQMKAFKLIALYFLKRKSFQNFK